MIMNIRTPSGWRKGQSIYNFLAWLVQEGLMKEGIACNMADPFYIEDEDWDRWYDEFLKQMGGSDED